MTARRALELRFRANFITESRTTLLADRRLPLASYIDWSLAS